MNVTTLLLFLGVDLLLILTPGPDWLYVAARGLGQGRRAGLTAVAGICSGYAVHTLLAAVGLAAALRAVPGALPLVRYAGAAYLVVLAVRTLLTLRRPGGAVAALEPEPGRAVLRQSMLTALLNPKGLLLYLSLMPQFIVPGGSVPMGVQLAVLGMLHVLGCALIYGLLALAAARAGQALTGTPKAARRLTAVSGGLLLAVAAMTLSAR
ncbi:LysE family translocator [Nonomuraea sp. NPDC049152]|uniref:LysE family translocator n=1 Tax=Nonomuraea sp. NPDC049152 TaxID=3154350 RepID=UPI00340A39FC